MIIANTLQSRLCSWQNMKTKIYYESTALHINAFSSTTFKFCFRFGVLVLVLVLFSDGEQCCSKLLCFMFSLRYFFFVFLWIRFCRFQVCSAADDGMKPTVKTTATIEMLFTNGLENNALFTQIVNSVIVDLKMCSKSVKPYANSTCISTFFFSFFYFCTFAIYTV